MADLEQFYEFSPTNQRLIDFYLRSKIAGGKNVGGDNIHNADVSSDHPYDLVRKHAPARGSGTSGEDARVWFFFSPKRYVGGNSKTSSGSHHRLRNRARTVLGVDGKKKGAWHTEGRKKTVPGSHGGYFQKLSYEEVTPSGSIVKPGWLMVEYAIEEDEDHGGGDMVLCKVYKSPRGPGSGSDVSSSSRKRKACVVVEETVVEQLQQRPGKRTNEEDMFLAGNLLQREDVTAIDNNAAAPAYQETTEHVLGSGESVAAANQCAGKTDQVPVEDEGQQRIQEDAKQDELTRFWESLATGHGEMALQEPPDEFNCVDYLLQEDQPVPPCAGAPQTEDEDDVMEISFKEFMGSPSLAGAVALPCAAQPEDAEISRVSCVQMSQVQPANGGGDEIEFTFEELMGSSTPGGYSSMPSPGPLTDDDKEDDDDDMRGLVCPPMDYAILEALVELDPAIMEEEDDFICDL